MIVLFQLGIGDDLSRLDCRKPFRIENFSPECTIADS